MADNTIIQQGRFTSEGETVILDIRSDTDWMEVINETQFATTQTPGRGVQFKWQRGIAPDTAFRFGKEDASNILAAAFNTSGGFTRIPANIGEGPLITGTTITKAGPPVCTAANHGFSNGELVLFTNLTNMVQIAVTLFSVGNVTTNTFELTYFNTNTANFTAETAYEVRSFPDFAFTPASNWISAITKGSTTQAQLTAQAAHLNQDVGGVMKFNVSDVFGMTEINGLQGEILAFDSATNTYTVDIDSTSFTDFAYPAAAAFPFTAPSVVGVGGVSTSGSPNVVENLDFIGMKLASGAQSPAGSSGDVIYWKAGKSFSVSNT